MQIASILSDLTSLRVCDHNAALALVSTRAPAADTQASESSKQEDAPTPQRAANDPDMQRAMDLMELHRGVKMKHVQGEDQELIQARKHVDAVLAKLEN
ncbi:MAG: hypothetical protein L6R40_001332 [Gallowayella cf. fulva]|nr:MAG: hypothetical protein L6R40_001332 [Xanthomendoza cf. fulva]